eukprot:COSAG02_NODE_2857_length_7888_cov_4.283220_7_plen_168_part_00
MPSRDTRAAIYKIILCVGDPRTSFRVSSVATMMMPRVNSYRCTSAVSSEARARPLFSRHSVKHMSEVMIPLCCLSHKSCILHQSSHSGWIVVGVDDRKSRRSRAYRSPTDMPLFASWPPPSSSGTFHTPYLGLYLIDYIIVEAAYNHEQQFNRQSSAKARGNGHQIK